jgi:hypothetical protein
MVEPVPLNVLNISAERESKARPARLLIHNVAASLWISVGYSVGFHPRSVDKRCYGQDFSLSILRLRLPIEGLCHEYAGFRRLEAQRLRAAPRLIFIPKEPKYRPTAPTHRGGQRTAFLK